MLCLQKKLGYQQSQCWYNEANYTKEEVKESKANKEGMLFMAAQDDREAISGTWIIDSSCSNHITRDKELFKTLENTSQQMVRLSDGNELRVAGVGTRFLCSKTGMVSKLTKVQYVPQLAHNLLSMAELMASAYFFSFSNGKCNIKDENADTLLACVHMMTHQLFPLDAMNIDSTHATLNTSEVAKLWHKRFGHLNIRSLQLLAQSQLVRDLPNITALDLMSSYEIRAYRKQARQPFRKGQARRQLHH